MFGKTAATPSRQPSLSQPPGPPRQIASLASHAVGARGIVVVVVTPALSVRRQFGAQPPALRIFGEAGLDCFTLEPAKNHSVLADEHATRLEQVHRRRSDHVFDAKAGDEDGAA